MKQTLLINPSPHFRKLCPKGKSLVLKLLMLLSIAFAGGVVKAQSGTVTFTAADQTNIGTTLHDGTNSNDISGIQLNIFGAMTSAAATARTSSGSFVFYTASDLGFTYGGFSPIDVTSGSTVSSDANIPRIIVIMSNDGSEFNFKSIYVGDYQGGNSPIKFEGFRDGVSTGSVSLLINSPYEITFNSSNGLTALIFQDVDEVRISNQSGGDMASGIYADFNNIQIGAAVLPAPTVSSVSVPANATYKTGDALNFTVNFDQNVTVTGTPQLSLTLNTGGTVQASYTGGSSTSALTFRYTVQSGNLDNDGVTVGSLGLNGGTIKNSGATAAILTLNNVASTTGVKIDGIAPTVSSVSVPVNGTYITGQNLDFTVNFNEAVSVVTTGGTPYLPITLNTGGTVYASYISGSGTIALVFRYTVAAGNLDNDGVTVGSAITANGGTIKDTPGNSATLTLNSVGSTTGVLVDGIAPTVSSINRQTPSDATTAATSVVYRITFSESVKNVAVGNFTLTKTGTANGTISSVNASTGTSIDVTVNSISGVGTLRLDLNSSGTGITDNAGNAISGGYTSGQTYTIVTAGTFIGTDSDWGTAANWAGNAVPSSSTNVTIPSGKTVVISATTQASCNNLTVSGSLTIASTSSGTGSLIVSGSASGNVNAECYLTGNAWHVASPIASGGSISTFIQAPGNAIPINGSSQYGMMDYNESTNLWKDYFTTSTTGNFASGQGYCLRRSTDGVVTFTGTLYTSAKTINLIKTGQGWNCIGNPYTSAIDINSGSTNSSFLYYNTVTNTGIIDSNYGAIYLWDPSTSQYKVICNAGFSFTTSQPTRVLSQHYVAPGQGFFVKAATNGVSVTFTSAMQSHQNNTNAPFKAPAVTKSWPGIALKAASADASSSAIIAFNDNMTKGLDPTYDAGLLRGTNGLSLYTRLVEDNGVDFAIQCLPESYNNLIIPVGVDSKDGGEITFSTETANLPADCKVILEDKTTNTFTSLTDGATYKTTVAAGSTAVGRFYIRTSGNTTTGTSGVTAQTSSLKAYIANEAIIIEGEVGDQAIATLYNLQGLKVRVNPLQKGSLNTLPCSDLMKGIYLLTIQQNGETATRKLIKE